MASNSTGTMASKFVLKEVFNAYVQTVNSRLDAEEKLNDMRLDKIEAIINETLAQFNGGLGLLNERINSLSIQVSELEKRDNERFAYIETVFNEKLNHLETKFDERLNHVEAKFDEKLEHVTDKLTEIISGLDTRLTDMKDDLKTSQNKKLALWGIGVALFVGAVQVIVSLALHFWG